jgi:hypothetical protein
MLHANDPDRGAAPRVFVGRATGGHVLRCHESLPDDAAGRLADVVARLPVGGDLRIPATTLSAVREALERPPGAQPVKANDGGPTYRFPAAPEPSARTLAHAGQVVQLTGANLEVVRETYAWLYQAHADWAPCFALVQNGAAVSVCFTSRRGAIVAEAGLETLPAFRGRGYATVVTAAWGAAIAASGRIPLYSTGWNNSASQGVARRLGLVMFGADASWT